ncbi:MAG: hypothetical protein U0169_23375 [Polyangiaceae bacterium]
MIIGGSRSHRSNAVVALVGALFLIALSACSTLAGLDDLTLAQDGGPRTADASGSLPRGGSEEDDASASRSPRPDGIDLPDSGKDVSTSTDDASASETGDSDVPDTGTTPDAGGDSATTDGGAEGSDAGTSLGLDASETPDAADDFCDITGTCACSGDDQCREGFKCCGGFCADVANDANHCGTCDVACSNGRVCEQGTCGCGGLDPFCSSVCVDYFSDSENCGRCGHSCFGGECIGGACQPVVLASEQDSPTAVAVDKFNVYFAAKGSNSIGRVPRSGPECAGPGCMQFTHPSICEPVAIAVDPANVYVASFSGGGTGAIVQVDTGFSGATVLANVQAPTNVATANGRVYWTSRTDPLAVGWVPVNGGAIFPVVPNPNGDLDVRALATDGVSVVWGAKQPRPVPNPTGIGGPNPIGSLFHLSTSATCTGHGCTPVITSAGVPVNFHLSGQWLYWTSTDGSVRKMAKTGGCQGITPCPILLAQRQPDPQYVVVDGDEVYWTNAGDGTLRHSSVYRTCNGVRCQALAGGLGEASGLAQDSGSLYFASKSHGGPFTGAIYRIAK